MRQRFWKWLRSYADRHVEPESVALGQMTITGGMKVSGTGISITGTHYRND